MKPVDPWRPSRVAALIVFFTPAAAGTLAWNWKRLNKSEWFGPAIALALIPLPILVAIGIFVMISAENSNSDAMFLAGLGAILLGAGWTYGMIFAQWYLQGPAYQHYQEKPDWEGLAAFDYPLRNAALILIAVAAVFPAMMMLMIALD
jgi:hypothetical protein